MVAFFADFVTVFFTGAFALAGVFFVIGFFARAGEDFLVVAILALYMTSRKLTTRLCYNIAMTKGAERKEFARRYVARTGMFSNPTHQARALATSLRTIVVDTAHLTDGRQVVTRSWLATQEPADPLVTAHLATVASTSPLMKGLHDATTMPLMRKERPAATGSGDVEWSAWHDGSRFTLTVTGGIAHVLGRCDVTENEREQIILQARKFTHGHHIVFATATGTSDQATLSTETLIFEGLVVCSLSLLPGTAHAIARLRALDIRLAYITTEPEDTATAIAHAAGITIHPKTARHADFANSPDHAIYAHATRVNTRRIIASLPQPLIIARHSLAELVVLLDACR